MKSHYSNQMCLFVMIPLAFIIALILTQTENALNLVIRIMYYHTGKYNFCHMKTKLRFLMYFSMLNSNMLLDFLYHPQFLCDRIF